MTIVVDMTFTHEGNKTYLDGLVNFEKMHMLAQTMRTIRYCRSRHLGELQVHILYFILVVPCIIILDFFNLLQFQLFDVQYT